MNPRYSRAALTLAFVAFVGLAAAGPSLGADVYLTAQPFTKTMPDGVAVPMWGFALCDSAFTNCAAPSSPGPVISVPAGDSLNVHLLNGLAVPVSLVIPGQMEDGGGDPTPGLGGRMQSFTREAPLGGTADYMFSNPRPGTYLYQSGTLPSIQVPMGLYGALVVTPSIDPGCTAPQQAAYDDGTTCHDSEAVVLYSEVDPVQNQVVQDHADGFTADYPATIDYNPQYFLVNGAPYDTMTPPGAIGVSSGTLLLRLLNAGLRSHAAAIVGLETTVLAEDGHLYPTPRIHSSTLLPAGKTLDALAAPADNATYAIYDRMLALTNANEPGGGLLTYLQVGTGSPAVPPSGLGMDDYYTVPEDASPFSRNASQGVLVNDGGATNAQLVIGPSRGELTLNANGSFSYTPEADYSGPDSFTYSATSGGGTISATAWLSVTFVNDGPVAGPDGPYSNAVGTTISVATPGVLGNDTDADGDTLTAQLVGSGPPGLTLNPDGSFTYTGAAGTQTFRYRASDGSRSSANITVTLVVDEPNGPLLTVLGPGGSVGEYRWVLEEDRTFHPDPAANNPETLATSFHRSHMPVVAQGCVTQSPGPDSWCATSTPLSQAVINPSRHYFVSVLPADAGTDAGHTLGGAQIAPHASSVTVNVNQAPVPWAQIHVLVFEDDSPTNGAPDGNEVGLGGFQINLEDAGGRYGASAGAMMFDAFGEPLRNHKDCGPGVTTPDNLIVTCPDGTALIKNLAPGKYGVTVVPPAGSGVTWKQTSTIEGKRTIDAWVKAGEPAYFQEFGPPGYHVFVGFVSPEHVAESMPPGGGNTVTGRITNLHMSRPPDQTLWDSDSRGALVHTTAWVGLNSAGGVGDTLAVAPADDEGNFSLSGIPDGSYQLVVWDDYLDQIIAFRNVTLPGDGALGNVPVFQWFSRLENHVFLDVNEDGVRDPGEEGMPEQNVNIRFRDGSVYLGAPTDGEGYVPFDEVFPFFHWLVAETDFTRHDATGVTVTVDGGGDVTGTGGVLNPQVGSPRTETGPVLTQAFQGFLGQTSVIEWGKKPHAPGQNGGISGIVYYATTRAENDPRLAAAEPWEPGIPGVTVRLHREVTRQDGTTGFVFVAETLTDSWDAMSPTGCPGGDTSDPVTPPTRCYDGLRNFNQIRPGVFDGGYAFNDIPAGRYVVEVIPPSGFEIVKEEDKNVDFGDVFAVAMMLPNMAMVEVMPAAALVAAALEPEPGLAQPACVGEERAVPDFLALSAGWATPIEAPFAGEPRPLCNRKEVVLNDQANGVADFFLFTEAPIAAHAVGMILDDTAQEFNPASIQFGEKWAPPFVPVAFYDYTGREIARVVSDEFGRFNALLPSTFSMNEPMFSGASPAMLTSCMNDPGQGPTPDPQYNPVYGTFCYTLQYMPGTTTYLDTPVVPTAAFAAGFPSVDCAFPNGTPMINQVNGDGIGPWVSSTGNLLTIVAQGSTSVPNPAYEGPGSAAPNTISRDYGFGSTPGDVTVGGIPLTGVTWTDTQITGTVPAGADAGGQLVVTRGDNGRFTMTSVTVHVGGAAPTHVTGPGAASLPEGPIQDAIDAASPGDLIIVDPGTYPELVIMTKPVRLQGAGPGSTVINAAKVPAEKLQNWRAKLDAELGTPGSGNVDLLPTQQAGAGGVEPDTLNTEQGAGVTVLGRSDARCDAPSDHCFSGPAARIDGFTITGGDSAGALYVNGWAHGLEISNNVATGNSGFYHGGIRVGVPFMEGLELLPDPPFGFNRDLRIHHNAITRNGGLGGAGGGVLLCAGTDGYQLTENWVCGNFTQGHGAGVAHFGLSDGGLIARNRILFNQSFNQGLNVHGGGLLVAGEPAVGAGMSFGSGSVTADSNLIQGNQAGAGHGAGIRTQFVNGQELDGGGAPYLVRLINNMVVDNVAGWAGGGISLMDTVNAEIVNNTVARNDSTATVGAAFISPTESALQPAGIVSERHSPALAALGAYGTFSQPTILNNNIVWENRSFHYMVDAGGTGSLQPVLNPTGPGACDGGTPIFLDFGVLGGGTLTHTNSIQTGSNPQFASGYCNTARSTQLIAEVTTLQTAPALDEGGNFIDVRFGPITHTRADGTPFGDYHIFAGSNAIDAGSGTGAPSVDFDNDARAGAVDIGADEWSGE